MLTKVFGLLLPCTCALVVALVAGCRTHEEQQDRVVESARVFLLKNAKDLDAEQRAFVRFNRPIFLVAPIIGRAGISELPTSQYAPHEQDRFPAANIAGELNQVCVAWSIPGKDKWYMVYGSDRRDLRFWSPERLICKEFQPFDFARNTALIAARGYAVNNLFYQMDVKTYNNVRFNNPEIRRSIFDVAQLDQNGVNTDQNPLQPGEVQISLIWPVLEDENKKIVLCGASSPELKKWRVLWGGIVSTETVVEHVIPGEVKTDVMKLKDTVEMDAQARKLAPKQKKAGDVLLIDRGDSEKK